MTNFLLGLLSGALAMWIVSKVILYGITKQIETLANDVKAFNAEHIK